MDPRQGVANILGFRIAEQRKSLAAKLGGQIAGQLHRGVQPLQIRRTVGGPAGNRLTGQAESTIGSTDAALQAELGVRPACQWPAS
jgi:hypothetical protein